MTNVANSLLDTKTPADVVISLQPRRPVTDPTLGISVNITKTGTPKNRLVTIGDSITQGFQSGAIFNTQLSYPVIIAKELGWNEIRYPTYQSPTDGLPLNVERLAHDLEKKFGSNINPLEFVNAALFIRQYLDINENYWERGEGSLFPIQQGINHNLAVYGWDLRNTISRNADICINLLKKQPPKDDFLRLIVENHNDRAAIRVLNSARDSNGVALSPVQAAAALGEEGTPDTEGIETLIVIVGANNALGSILTFNVVWSDNDYVDMEINDKYTVWRPIHFKAELDELVAEVKKIRARHVIFGTVPHITIVPFARGVDHKVKPGSRYFPYYTLPWIQDKDFDPKKHPNLTQQEARAIDSAIDQYNDYITDAVRQARTEGRDWYLFEMAGLLDRLASRRFLQDPTAKPEWWDEVGGAYPLPPELQALKPVPDSRFLLAGANGRTQGGLFSLDGIHPTTIGYGIIAQELIKIMQLAGVKFYQQDGKTERQGEIQVNFQSLIKLDSLVSRPPKNLLSLKDIIGGLDKNFNILSNMLNSNY